MTRYIDCSTSCASRTIHYQYINIVIIIMCLQGDGTALIFQDKPAVFTLSVHAANNFPARKQKSSLDVPLPDGMGDDDYLR